MIGKGRLPVCRALSRCARSASVSPPLLEAADRIPRRWERVGGRAADTRAGLGARQRPCESTEGKVFAAHLTHVDSNDVSALRLGKRAEAAYERAIELTRTLDRYAYGVDLRFEETDVDQARAAGVVIEFEARRRSSSTGRSTGSSSRLLISRTVDLCSRRKSQHGSGSARPRGRAG